MIGWPPLTGPGTFISPMGRLVKKPYEIALGAIEAAGVVADPGAQVAGVGRREAFAESMPAAAGGWTGLS